MDLPAELICIIAGHVKDLLEFAIVNKYIYSACSYIMDEKTRANISKEMVEGRNLRMLKLYGTTRLMRELEKICEHHNSLSERISCNLRRIIIYVSQYENIGHHIFHSVMMSDYPCFVKEIYENMQGFELCCECEKYAIKSGETLTVEWVRGKIEKPMEYIDVAEYFEYATFKFMINKGVRPDVSRIEVTNHRVNTYSYVNEHCEYNSPKLYSRLGMKQFIAALELFDTTNEYKKISMNDSIRWMHHGLKCECYSYT